MRRSQLLLSALAGVAALALVGCDIRIGRPRPEPVYVVQPAPPPPEPAYVIVREPPPALIVEKRPPPPSNRHIWIEGYWHWDGHRYAWERGRWEIRPHPKAVWVVPRYDHDGHAYRYKPGYWKQEHH